MFDLQLNDREHTDRHCMHHDSDMRCIYHHHCDTDALVNNDNICCMSQRRFRVGTLQFLQRPVGNITNTQLYYTL